MSSPLLLPHRTAPALGAPRTSRARRRRRVIDFLCAFLGAVVLLMPVAPPARAQALDVNDMQRRVREQQYQAIRQSVANMPLLDAKSMDDVVRLKMANRHVVGSSPLLSAPAGHNRQLRVALLQFKGPTSVVLSTRYQAGPANAVAGRAMITFTSYLPHSDDALTVLQLQAWSGGVSLMRSTQSSDGNRLVRLYDQAPTDAEPGSVQLSIAHSGTMLDPVGPLTLTAPDLATLVREHSAEAARYLRPLLHDLGQEQLLAPDPVQAWQVFADRWHPDDQLGQKVAALLATMKNGDFHVRERAVADLQALGDDAALTLTRMDRNELSPEQNLLIARAIGPFAALPPDEVKQLQQNRGFLLDCLYSPDRRIRSAALDRLRSLSDGDVTFDLDAEGEKRTEAVAALREKLQPTTRPSPTTKPAQR